MSERYRKVFSLPEHLYSPTIPIVMMAGVLYEDQMNNCMVAQLKFKNISNKMIRAIRISIIQKDAFNRLFTNDMEYVYRNCNVAPYTDFGDREAIIVDNNTSSFSIEIKEILFDGEEASIYNESNFEQLPKQSNLQTVLSDNALKAYLKHFNSNIKYIPMEYKNLIICGCGMAYSNELSQCPICNNSFESLKQRIDNDQLENEYQYEVAKQSLLKAKSKEDYQICANQFKTILDYEDSKQYYQQCLDKCEEIDSKKKKQKLLLKKSLIFIVLIACVTGAGLLY